MDKRTKLGLIGSTVVILIVMIALGAAIVEKLTPSKEVKPLTDYYKLTDAQVLVILQNEIYEKKGILLDGKVYIDYDTVAQEFNHRFYWDNNENVLTYTTPTEILQAEADSNKYTITKSTIKTDTKVDYPIVEVFADKVYVSLEFVKQYSDLNYQFYSNPNRVVINYKWGDYLYTEVTKATQLRESASIKSPILVQLPIGTSLLYVNTEDAPKKGFVQVMTEDGVVGYIKENATKKSNYKTINSNYQAPQYTAQTRAGKINMVFHQVFNEAAADHLEGLIKATKGVNVVSPTWFSINNVSGTISSIATTRYVEKAKNLGLEVWALVDDFNPDVSMYELLSHTSRRETLSNALIEAALQYKLNGINIDFEKIPLDAGVHYIQFLRELSVKCRNNGIVLSVDNYVPSAYTEYYDREEQGNILDYVVVMAYDEHHGGSEVAGPVSSLGFVTDAVNNILTMVPKEKVIIAIPFYTRLWKETQEGTVSSESYAMTPAANVLSENGAKPAWDDASGSYYSEYLKDGITYRMWQEEEKSIEEKMKVIYNAEVAGIAAWKLGLEKESIWNVIVKYLN
jgi:spore germination protein YaaH